MTAGGDGDEGEPGPEQAHPRERAALVFYFLQYAGNDAGRPAANGDGHAP